MKIEEIKENCIQSDINNNIGIESTIRAYYKEIPLNILLKIFYSINGLDCLKRESNLIKEGYYIEIDDLINYLK